MRDQEGELKQKRDEVEALRQAIKSGREGEVERIISQDTSLANVDLTTLTKVLHYVIKDAGKGDQKMREIATDVVMDVIDRGADLTALDGYGCTPLYKLLMSAHVDAGPNLLNFIIKRALDISPLKNDPRSGEPIYIRNAKLALNKYINSWPLAEAEREPPTEDESTTNMIGNFKTEIGNRIRISTLLTAEEVSDVNVLINAARSGSQAAVEFILEKGSNVNAQDAEGKTPLHYAANGDVARALLDRGSDVNAQDAEGKTPLHYAANGDVANALLDCGSDVNALDMLWKTPLHCAANGDVVRALLAVGADVNARFLGFTPLHYAANGDVVRALLAVGADVNAKDFFGFTPLHFAEKGDVARALLDGGANVNAESFLGVAPLEYTLWKGMHEVVKEISDYKERNPSVWTRVVQAVQDTAELAFGNGAVDTRKPKSFVERIDDQEPSSRGRS